MATIEHLADRAEIADALTRYAHGLDQRAWELWDGLFTQNAILDYRGANMAVFTPDEFRAKVAANDATRISGQHLHTNVLITIDGDDAVAASEYTMVTMTRADAQVAHRVRAGGTATFRLRRVGGRWQIATRTTTVKWLDRGDIPWPP